MADKTFISTLNNTITFVSIVESFTTFISVVNNQQTFVSTISPVFANLDINIARGYERFGGFVNPSITITPIIRSTEYMSGSIIQSGIIVTNNYPQIYASESFGGNVKYKLTVRIPSHGIIGTDVFGGSIKPVITNKNISVQGTIVDSGSVTGQLQHYELLSDYDSLYLNDMDSFNLSDLDLVIV